MLSDTKILVTGPAGQIALPMTEYLARDNEVWGIARFSAEGSRERVESVGATTRVVDLASGEFGDLPNDFDYVVHMAAYQGAELDFDRAVEVNAVGTGLLMQHCQKAKAALVASTFSVYGPNPEPGHLFAESDPISDARAPHSPTYSVSKYAQEAVARTMARALDLPTVITRINATYGPNGGLPAYWLDWLLGGSPIFMRVAGQTYNPIHSDDMNEQVEKLLGAATTPATIVNWAGDDAVTVEEAVGFLGELTGVEPSYQLAGDPAGSQGIGSDNTKRRALIGDCRIDWRTGLEATWRARYPDGVNAASDTGADALGTTLGDG